MPMKTIVGEGHCPGCGAELVGNFPDSHLRVQMDDHESKLVYATGECDHCGFSTEIPVGCVQNDD